MLHRNIFHGSRNLMLYETWEWEKNISNPMEMDSKSWELNGNFTSLKSRIWGNLFGSIVNQPHTLLYIEKKIQ